MYPVRGAFLQAVQENTRKYYWTGKVTTKAGVEYSFGYEDIVKGSGYITAQCCGSTEIELGTVYAAEMGITLFSQIEHYTLEDAKVELSYHLWISDGSFEKVPMGIFEVSEANRTAHCLELKAYDYMLRFEKSFNGFETVGNAYAFLSLCCKASDVELAHTQADGEQLTCIIAFNCKIGGKQTLKCVGKNPRLSQAKSKNDKNISGLLNQIEAGKIGIHTFTNASAYSVAQTDVRIISIEFASKEETHVQFFGQVVADVSAVPQERTASATGNIVVPFPAEIGGADAGEDSGSGSDTRDDGTSGENGNDTNAVNNILGINLMGVFYAATGEYDDAVLWNESLLPVCPNMIGGILLFSNALEEDADNIYQYSANMSVHMRLTMSIPRRTLPGGA